MSSDPNDFRVEIIKSRPQGIVSPTLGSPVSGDVLDVTKYVIRDSVGSVNRATDRDLLSFKTGDMTMAFKNGDGYFDDLFAFFGATDTWGCRVYRRGVAQFYGCLIGLGSITFDRKIKTCEVTVYGLTKLLDMTAADTVKRTIADTTVTTATLGASTLTVASTSGLLSGDTLHLTDHANAEDVTVKQVTSATVVSLEAALVRTYAAGSSVSCTTPFYRYKTISYLVNALFTEAGIGIAELRINDSQFDRAAPTPVNIDVLQVPEYSVGVNVYAGFTKGSTQKGGKHFVSVGYVGVGIETFSQDTPDGAWTSVDTTAGGWMDWSKYYTDGSAEPAIPIRNNLAANDGEMFQLYGYWCVGCDFKSVRPRLFHIYNSLGTAHLRVQDSANGLVWAPVVSGALPADNAINTAIGGQGHGVEYDPGRGTTGLAVVSWNGNAGGTGTRQFQYLDMTALTWTDMKQADDVAATGYFGPAYCADLDVVFALRGTAALGPAFELCAFRGTTRLWKRPFPSCLIESETAISGHAGFYPTRSMRYMDGILYCVAISDGVPQLIWSRDQFQTYTMRPLGSATTHARVATARVNGSLRIACYSGATARNFQIAAPFYAGTVAYADFDGLSCAEALKKLSVLTNALFFVDDDLQGHFIARDLYDPGNVFDMSNVITDESDDFLWDQTAQYVTASGNSVKATAGLAAFAADGIALDSSFLPNEAFAQALADSYFAFYSALRKYISAGVHDVDGHIYQPMDRVFIDSMRYLVYESDHDLIGDSVSVQLLEDR